MKVKTSYEGCEYITAGKVYEVTVYGKTGETIIDDDGDVIEIVLPRWGFACGQLDSIGKWELV